MQFVNTRQAKKELGVKTRLLYFFVYFLTLLGYNVTILPNREEKKKWVKKMKQNSASIAKRKFQKAQRCAHIVEKKQGGKAKWVVIVLVVIFTFIMIVGGQDDSSSSGKNTQSSAESTETVSDNSNAKAESKAETEGGTITAGQSFEANGLSVKVNEVSTDFTDYNNDYGMNDPGDGMKYVMASFTFGNKGKSDAYVSISDFTCYADDQKCEQAYGLDDNDFINVNLSSGRNVSFKSYYKVPADAQSIELEYTSNFWTSKKVIIKIQ